MVNSFNTPGKRTTNKLQVLFLNMEDCNFTLPVVVKCWVISGDSFIFPAVCEVKLSMISVIVTVTDWSQTGLSAFFRTEKRV